MNNNHLILSLVGKKNTRMHKITAGFNIDIANKITIILLKAYFSSILSPKTNKTGALISVPTFKVYSGGQIIKVQVFYYLSFPEIESNFISDSSKKALCEVVSKLYPRTIQVELQLVQQHQPYINASILAQYLSINASKYGFHRIITILLNAVPYYNPSTPLSLKDGNTINFCITGLKVQLSGLLTTQRNRARKTVYTVSAGTFHNLIDKGETKPNISATLNPYGPFYKTQGKINIDYAQSTSKSREGTFNIKVFISSINS